MAYEHQTENCECFICLQRRRHEAGEPSMTDAIMRRPRSPEEADYDRQRALDERDRIDRLSRDLKL